MSLFEFLQDPYTLKEKLLAQIWKSKSGNSQDVLKKFIPVNSYGDTFFHLCKMFKRCRLCR